MGQIEHNLKKEKGSGGHGNSGWVECNKDLYTLSIRLPKFKHAIEYR